MNEKHAKPGNIIKIIKGSLVDQEFLVVECPDNHQDRSFSHCAWVEMMGSRCFFLNPESYEIISQTNKQKKDDVDTFLKKQLNTNLRNLFT